MEVPLLFDRPITAWLSIGTGFTALSLIVFAILLMHQRLRRLVSHKKWLRPITDGNFS